MRPIDADALKEQLEDWLKLIQGYTSDEHEITRDVLLSVIHSCIAGTPTLDVQPVRRGEWGVLEIVGYDGVNAVYAAPCSACGEFSKEARLFCPNCGADMRGDASGTN